MYLYIYIWPFLVSFLTQNPSRPRARFFSMSYGLICSMCYVSILRMSCIYFRLCYVFILVCVMCCF